MSKSVAEERVEWLEHIDWRVWATAIFPTPVSMGRARLLFDSFHDRMEQLMGTHVGVVYGLELYSKSYESKVGWHFHFALAALTDIPLPEMRRLWRTVVHGSLEKEEQLLLAEPFDKAKAGISYILKMADSAYASFWDVKKLEYYFPNFERPTATREDRKREARWKELLMASLEDESIPVTIGTTKLEQLFPRALRRNRQFHVG